MNAKRQSLGKGLDALLGMADETEIDSATTAGSVGESGEGQLRELPVDLLQRGKYQPRRDINAEALEELASSIRTQGVMQPLVVRKVDDEKYEIIAGERRWRAAQQAASTRCRLLFVKLPTKRQLPWPWREYPAGRSQCHGRVLAVAPAEEFNDPAAGSDAWANPALR